MNYEKGIYPYKTKLSNKEYEQQKLHLQAELLKVQRWVGDDGEKIVTIFEGHNAAGKGGAIKRFMEHLNPRSAHVVALEKPTNKERGQWYFQRYIRHFPTEGEMVFFDRSWYNRTGVERVMGFCNSVEYLDFLRQCPLLERMITNAGITLNKYWFPVSRLEQLRRFHARKTDPLKQWKLSPIDMESLNKWDAYTRAKESMFFYTDTADAPWTAIKSDDKKRARIECMRHFLSKLNYPDKNTDLLKAPDPLIVGSASSVYDKKTILLISMDDYSSMKKAHRFSGFPLFKYSLKRNCIDKGHWSKFIGNGNLCPFLKGKNCPSFFDFGTSTFIL